MNLTSLVQQKLRAKGLETELRVQGKLAKLVVAGEEKMLAENPVLVRSLSSQATNPQIASQVVNAIMAQRKGRSTRATIREVVLHPSADYTQTAVTYIGFL